MNPLGRRAPEEEMRGYNLPVLQASTQREWPSEINIMREKRDHEKREGNKRNT